MELDFSNVKQALLKFYELLTANSLNEAKKELDQLFEQYKKDYEMVYLIALRHTLEAARCGEKPQKYIERMKSKPGKGGLLSIAEETALSDLEYYLKERYSSLE
jgi:hypothetical protein